MFESGTRDTKSEPLRNEDWHAVFCKSDWAEDTPMKTLVLFFFLNRLEKCNKGGNSPKTRTHMTFSTNWYEIFCNITNSWLPLTHYLWLSLSSSSSFTMYHLFSFSPALFLHFSQRLCHSLCCHTLKGGWLFFYIRQISFICSRGDRRWNIF